MNSYIGQLLDNRYELLEVIGTGGMAVVYKARCHRLNRFVAVKVLKDEFSGDEEFRRRFRAEGEAVAMLSHPNIVQVFDVSSADNAYFIVMELIDGISLKQYMEVKGVLNWKETIHFGLQIAKGLEHAHSRGIVHRDIKPHNVMVLKNGSVKVMDFGIAQVMNKSSTLTKEALGSVHYISPEQAKGSYTDNRSDIYSLGVVMYEMMAGRPPYDGDSPVSVAIQHINGGAKLPSTYNPNIPKGLEQIIMRCMALDARDRFSSATELLQDLEEFRKNPAMTFPYTSVMNDATQTLKGIPQKPRTTAEKVVQNKGGTVSPPQKPNPPLKLRPQTMTSGISSAPAGTTAVSRDTAALRRAKQRREEEERIAAERHKVGTIAVVVCSIVAVIAIIVFLWAIFNGALLNSEDELVKVPNLIGDLYSESMEERYSNFVIRLQPQQYDDVFANGQIMYQKPEGGEEVKKGTEIYITVSMGPEPAVKIMENLVGVTLDRAQSFLVGQGFKVLPYDEYSEQEPGVVIRTEPGMGTELVDGQTIKLWISKGPDIIKSKMPDVVGMDKGTALKVLEQLGFLNVTTNNIASSKPEGQVINQSYPENTELDVNSNIVLEISEGPQVVTASMPQVVGLDKETALNMLEKLGFTNVSTDTVESSKPKGQVVAQSVPKNTELDVTEHIKLEISEGPKETQPPTEATQPPKTTESIPFTVPSRAEAYLLSIFLDGREVVSNVRIQPGVNVITVELEGTGTVEYDLFIDGEYYQTQRVTFQKNG